MKKIRFICLLLCMLTCTGCAGISEPTETETKSELTPDKIEFLKTVSMATDNINDGELYSWQEDLLEQYDAGMECLAKKYPSHTFHITNADWVMTDDAAMAFFMTADDGNSYEMYVDKTDDGYEIEDTFFGHLIEEDYGDLMTEFLRPLVPSCVACRAWFVDAMGEEYTEQVTAQQIFDGTDDVPNTVEIYLRSGAEAGLVNTIQTAVKEKGLYGAYEVYFLQDLPEGIQKEDIYQYVKDNRKSLIYKAFQNF